MAFIGVNPGRHVGLEALKRSCVELLGIPAPLPQILAAMPLDEERAAVISRLKRKLSLPRVDRDATFREAIRDLRDFGIETFGTEQKPFMVEIDDVLFTTFIPDLMDGDEVEAFRRNWGLRGLVPAQLEARKGNNSWSYHLVASWYLV